MGRTRVVALAVVIAATFALAGVVASNRQQAYIYLPSPLLPYPDAPLCPDSGELHDNNLFHTLWDSTRGCHYDHEHGQNPFRPEVAAAFPGFDLRGLLGGVGVGHTNPSSPMENTHKHGGFKWQVTVPTPQGCVIGFEGAATGIDAAVIQYHNFGDYSVEFESRVHSALAMLRQCHPGKDPGYVYVVQHVDYGQRVVPYQGTVAPYPDTYNPVYMSGLGPYFTVDCVNGGVIQCRASRDFVLSHNASANSIWTSKSAFRVAPSGSSLLAILFRVRDTYQLFDWNDQVYPFTFIWLCSLDGGATYSALPGCRYNNSTSTVHEVSGMIPASWDNLAGFDTDPEVRRITAEGFTTRFGELNLSCTAPGPDCHPIKLVRAFVGRYGGELGAEKVSNPTTVDTPERDIYFCGDMMCTEGDPGAMSSGWIGPNN